MSQERMEPRKDGTSYTICPRNAARKQNRVTFKSISFKKVAKLVKKKGNELFAVRVRPKMEELKVDDRFKDLVDEFYDIFVEELPNNLPPSRELDFQIQLKSDVMKNYKT